jgi:hypothetical protein
MARAVRVSRAFAMPPKAVNMASATARVGTKLNSVTYVSDPARVVS